MWGARFTRVSGALVDAIDAHVAAALLRRAAHPRRLLDRSHVFWQAGKYVKAPADASSDGNCFQTQCYEFSTTSAIGDPHEAGAHGDKCAPRARRLSRARI